MRIAYVLENTGLAGGTRVAVAHADALIERGLARPAQMAHVARPLEYQTRDFAAFDFVVATFWTTVAPTCALAKDRSSCAMKTSR